MNDDRLIFDKPAPLRRDLLVESLLMIIAGHEPGEVTCGRCGEVLIEGQCWVVRACVLRLVEVGACPPAVGQRD